MGFCTKRNLFLSLCIIQVICMVQRQVFDYLGYLWIPSLMNFLEIIFIIFGFFGAYQYRPKYIISYLLWNIIWLAWNIFIICLYLDVAGLDHTTNKVLKLDGQSDSWWIKGGPGCKLTGEGDPSSSITTGCYVNYIYVEVFQAGLQCFFTFVNSIIGFCLSRLFLEEDDNFEFEKIDGPEHYLLHPMYVSNSDNLNSKANNSTTKRLNSAYKRSQKSPSKKTKRAHAVDAVRIPKYDNTQRKSRKNQKRMSLYSIEFSSHLENRNGDSDNDFDNVPPPVSPKPMTPRRVKRRSVMTRGSSGRHSTSTRKSHARSSTRSARTRMAQNPVTRLLEQQQQQKVMAYDSPTSPSPIESPLPNYYNAYNSASNNNLLQQQNWQTGHANPTYQQSSTQSLNDTNADFEDFYNNRPPSARSSYSNFHGTRAINYPQQKYYHSHATPQVPQKRASNPNRNSMRSMTFLNNGPPAYTFQGQVPVDSETTI